MPRIPCKGINKDGTPCRGNGLPQYDGYCIGHGPAEVLRESRARGGRNSSNAARADKRLPERLQGVIEALTQGISDVRAGTLDPAAYTAICRGVKVLLEVHRFADEEMELVRSEEIEAAAAEIAGVQGDLTILNAAARMSAERDRYTIESLIEQGLVTMEPGIDSDTVEPVLTDAGRRRFGLQRLTSYTQQDIDRIEGLLERPEIDRDLRNAALSDLLKMRSAIAEAMQDLEREPDPVRDPLTGRTLSEPPAGVKVGRVPVPPPVESESDAEILEGQREQVERLIQIFQERFENELARDYLESLAIDHIGSGGPVSMPSYPATKNGNR